MFRKLTIILSIATVCMLAINVVPASDTARGTARNSPLAAALVPGVAADTLSSQALLPAVSAPQNAAPAQPVTDVQYRRTAVTSRTGARASMAGHTTALNWALSQRGKPYVYGASGPGSYDCSGLVMRAYQHAGISLPRTTGGMLGSSKLRRTSHPVRGDLAFFGSGHVELYTSGGMSAGVSFGAHHSGTTVGYRSYSSYYHPSGFYHVVGS